MLWILWKSAQIRSYFLCGCKSSYIQICTIKLYDIVKVKDTMVKSMYYVTGTQIAVLLSLLSTEFPLLPWHLPGINSRWCHWGFFLWFPWQNHWPWGRLSLWKWVPGISPGVKVAGAYGWWPTTLVVPNVKIIQGPNLPGTPWATSACCGRSLLTLTLELVSVVVFPQLWICSGSTDLLVAIQP